MSDNALLFRDHRAIRTYLTLDQVGYFDPFTEEEIADCMGVSQQMVSKILHRALKKLAHNATIMELR